MTTTHTPGPWKQNDHPERHNQLYVRLGKGAANAVIEKKNPFGPVSDEDLANARLIAAAPDLLSAMDGLLEFLADYPHQYATDISDFVAAGEEAIAKATGEDHE